MDEILESLRLVINDFCARLAVHDCEGCVFLSKGINDNPSYCQRMKEMDDAIAVVDCVFCPNYISLDKVAKMQDEYKQLRDKCDRYERDENLRNYGGRG